MAFQYRIRSKEQWEARANQSGGDYEGWLKDEFKNYKPVTNENCIRILPPSNQWADAPHYGMEVYVHYGVGPDKASVICLYRMKKGRCPICEERARAEAAKDEDMTRELRAAKRVLVYLVNRKDEAQGPLAWGMPYTLDRDIVKASKDRATGTHYFIDNPSDGYDVYFDRNGEGMMTKYSGIVLAKKPTPVDMSVVEWADAHPIPEALRWRDYDEVMRLFTGAGRGEAPDEPPRSNGHDSGGGGGGGGRPERSERRSEASERPSERPIPHETKSERPAAVDTPPHDDNRGTPADEDRGPPFEVGEEEPSADGAERAETLAQIRARFSPRS